MYAEKERERESERKRFLSVIKICYYNLSRKIIELNVNIRVREREGGVYECNKNEMIAYFNRIFCTL